MKLQLLKPYGMASKGDVLPDVAPGVAEQLIRRGIAKVLAEAPDNKMFKGGKSRRK
jgi:hypothetical protein